MDLKNQERSKEEDPAPCLDPSHKHGQDLGWRGRGWTRTAGGKFNRGGASHPAWWYRSSTRSLGEEDEGGARGGGRRSSASLASSKPRLGGGRSGGGSEVLAGRGRRAEGDVVAALRGRRCGAGWTWPDGLGFGDLVSCCVGLRECGFNLTLC